MTPALAAIALGVLIGMASVSAERAWRSRRDRARRAEQKRDRGSPDI
jgi:hypothetical protein